MLPRPRVALVSVAILALIAGACASPPPPPTPPATRTPAGTPVPAPAISEPQPRLVGFRRDDEQSEDAALPRCDPSRQLATSRRQESAAAPGDVALDVIGQLGGHPHAIALQGDRLYLGVGPRVLVFETAPTLRQVATSPLLPGIVKGLVVEGGLLAAALGSSGLALLDLRSDAPALLGTLALPGAARGVELDDGVAYIAAEDAGLHAVDVGEPAHPRALATALDDREVLSVTATAAGLLVAAGEAGLIALDVSDPGAPAVAGSVVTGGYAFAVAADGTRAYLADGWGGLRIVEVSDRSDPRLLGSVPTAGWAQDVAVDRGVAVVAAGSQGLLTADVSDPRAPRALSTAPLAGRQAIQLAVAGGLAFVVDPFEGLEVVDLAAPAAPRWLGTWQPLLEGWGAAPSGDRVFVAAGRSGLRVVDASDPTRLRDVGAAPTVSMANAVAAVGAQVLVSTWPEATEGERAASLLAVDASDPAQPRGDGAFVQAGRLEHAIFPWEDSEFAGTDRDLSPSGVTRALAASGSTVAYATEVGVLLVDAESTPCELSYVQTRPYTQYRVGETEAIAIDGRYVFAGISYAPRAPMPDREPLGVAILDMADVHDPRWVATSDASAAGLLVNGRWLYALAQVHPREAIVTVVDVGDPAHPHTVGSLQFEAAQPPLRGPTAMAFAAGHLFVASGDAGVVAVDVSDPSRPRLAGRLDVLGNALGVASDGRHLYVGSDEAGLLIVDPRLSGEPAPPPGGFAGSLWSGTAAPLDRETVAIAPPTTLEPTGPPDCMVTSTNDDGPGSLRRCLVDARPGDVVGFDPAVFSREQPGTIRLESDLPTLQSDITINGGGGVILDGGGGKVFTSFQLYDAAGVTIRGLQIRGFQVGLFVDGSGTRGGHTIEGNVIGGNSFDLTLHMTSGNRVAGNYVGLDASGTSLAYDPRADNPFFIQLGSSMNLIEGNVFGVGVAVTDPGSYNNSFVGNRFGLNVAGRWLRCRCGLSLDQPFNRAGGSGPGEANIFAGGNCDELEGLCSRIFLQASDNVVVGSDAGHIWVAGQSSD